MSCSLLLLWKLAARQEDAFSLPASVPESSLIYLQDLLSSRRFVVNSGASVSAFPAAQFVIMREDASIPPLAPLYRSPYLVQEHRDKFFLRQMVTKRMLSPLTG